MAKSVPKEVSANSECPWGTKGKNDENTFLFNL